MVYISPMTNRLFQAAFILLAVAACSDGPTGNAPLAPRGRPAPLGMIRGTVTGKTMTAEFVPMGAQAAVGKNSAVSPAIYGGSTTVAITGTFVSLVDNAPVNRTWTFNVHMENLLSFPIGSNYSATNPAPPDTSGVFIGFSSSPVITQSTPCVACTITVANYAGLGFFTALNQPFFWYKDRPTAVQGSPGTDLTSDQQWKFTGSFKPSTGDTVHSFTFVLMVNAAWPPPNDTLWAYSYSGKTDSLPDQFAKPRWKTPYTQVNQYTTLGSETFNIGTDLVLTAATGTSSIYIARNDSLDAPSLASIFLEGKLGSAIAGVPIQAVIGIVQPGATGTQAVLGFYEDHVAFVHLDPVTGLWSDVATPGASFNVTATVLSQVPGQEGRVGQFVSSLRGWPREGLPVARGMPKRPHPISAPPPCSLARSAMRPRRRIST